MKAHWTIAAAALLGLTACQGETAGPTTAEYEAERQRLVQRSGQPNAGQAAPVAVPTEEQMGFGGLDAGYSYISDEKRDPFRSFVLDLEQMQEEERGPLEQFELNQLSLVAVVWDANHPRALIQDPSGQGYIVRTGTHVGKNEGEIVEIHDGSLVVTETYVDYLGDRTTKAIEMRIRTAQGG